MCTPFVYVHVCVQASCQYRTGTVFTFGSVSTCVFGTLPSPSRLAIPITFVSATVPLNSSILIKILALPG